MLTPDRQVEIVKRGVDAAFGYTQAAINATFETNARTLGAWSRWVEAMAVTPCQTVETWEWSGSPKRPHSTLLAGEQAAPRPVSGFALWSDWLHAGSRVWFKGAPPPFAWWAWTPQSAVPATWPWAYGLISSGVPESVAWPMAEANVALLDAAQKTAAASRPSYPAYHSQNGFAGQFWAKSPLGLCMVLAPGAAPLWPWLG